MAARFGFWVLMGATLGCLAGCGGNAAVEEDVGEPAGPPAVDSPAVATGSQARGSRVRTAEQVGAVELAGAPRYRVAPPAGEVQGTIRLWDSPFLYEVVGEVPRGTEVVGLARYAVGWRRYVLVRTVEGDSHGWVAERYLASSPAAQG